MGKLRNIVLVIISGSLLFLCGCVNLQSIRAFSEISAESTNYTAIVQDYTKIPDRAIRYLEGNADGVALLKNIAEDRKKQQMVLLTLHKTISQYMKALGELASDEVVPDKPWEETKKDLIAINDGRKHHFIEDDEIAACVNLSKLVPKMLTDLYRQQKLKGIIFKTNKDFQVIITALEKFVEFVYIPSLENEKAYCGNYYSGIISAAREDPPQEAAIGLLREKQFDREDAVDAKVAAARLYLDILNKIGKGHQLLYDDVNSISSKQVLANIAKFGEDISAVYASLKNIE